MLKNMKKSFGHTLLDIQFGIIIMDYFFMPEGSWIMKAWQKEFFSKTLPAMATEGIIEEGGQIWLPNMVFVQQCLSKRYYRDELQVHYEWERVNYPEYNPLYDATSYVNDELTNAPDGRTNLNQLKTFMTNVKGTQPFFKLTRRTVSQYKRKQRLHIE
jgi:hypothetical protein